MVGKPITACFHNFKLPLEILLRNSSPKVVLAVSPRMGEISNHSDHLRVVANSRLPPIPIVVQIKRGR